MPIPAPPGFSWSNYGAYAAFDRFIQCFVIESRSFVTKHPEKLDVAAALIDINQRFIEKFDAGDKNFDEKASKQFATAPINTKIFFANVEYLWAMPSSSMRPEKKREYALRWFEDDQVRVDPSIYFSDDDGIANPGMWYQTNKYHEISAILRILSHLFSSAGSNSIEVIKKQIEELCFGALYGNPAPHGGFKVINYCGVHSALLHLSAPDQYESIISRGNKLQILGTFQHIIADRKDVQGLEENIRLIRERIYGEYGADSDPKLKYRWFFYRDDVRSCWAGKTPKQQEEASINDEIYREESSPDFEDEEGNRIAVQGYRVHRSSKLVHEVKKLDGYSCRACKFHFRNQIVHVHHLDPLAEREAAGKTKKEDLITLCPNCHYLAHYLLRKRPGGHQYKNRDRLLKKLSTIRPRL